MNVLFYGLSLILFAALIHLIIWKIRLPKRQTGTLLNIFLFTLVIGTVLMAMRPGIIRWSILPRANCYEVLQFLLLYASLAASYILSYPAIEVDSPTLVIIKAVSEAGPGGLGEDGLNKMMDNGLLIIPRIKDMLSDSMIYPDGNRYRLTLKGEVIARTFLLYRYIIRGSKGG